MTGPADQATGARAACPIAPHPIAALLTDEQKARVAATEFVRDGNGISALPVHERDDRRCPLAIAVGMGCSVRPYVYRALGISEPHPDVESFMTWADSRSSDPSHVHALLGVDPIQAARPAAAAPTTDDGAEGGGGGC